MFVLIVKLFMIKQLFEKNLTVRYKMSNLVVFNLRRWQPGDEASLVKYANNYDIWRNVRDVFPYPYTYADAQDWIHLCEKEKQPTVFAIEVEGEAVGGIGIVLGKDIYRCNAEIGYWLGQPFWGKGIMTQAVIEVTAYAFRQFPVQRIFAGIFDYNLASMKVLQKAGYEREAILKKSLCKEQNLYDEYIYTIFRPKKPAIEPPLTS